MVKLVNATSDIISSVLGGVPTNLASEIIVRMTDKHADKIEGTFVGGLLKKSGIIPPNFKDELETLLKQSLEIFFEKYPEYVVENIDEYFLSPTFHYCVTRFALDGKTPNDDGVKAEFESLLTTEPQLRRMNIPIIYNRFLDVLIAVLSSEQTVGELLIRVQLTELEQKILKAIQGEVVNSLERLRLDLTLRDPFRPYLEKPHTYIRLYLEDNAHNLLELEAEDTPQAVIRAERKSKSNVWDRYFLGQRFANESQSTETDIGFEEAFQLYDERLLVLGEPGAGKPLLSFVMLKRLSSGGCSTPKNHSRYMA